MLNHLGVPVVASLSMPEPGFSIDAAVDRAMAALAKTLQPSLDEARRSVAKARNKRPLTAPTDLIGPTTRNCRIRAARAVSYSLPSILPGYGTAISAAALPVALREVLVEAVSAAVTVGVLYDRDLKDSTTTRASLLLILTAGAVKMDVTHRIQPDAILGRHAHLVGEVAGYDRLTAMAERERRMITKSQEAILWAWVQTVGAPMVAGLIPLGLGPMAAANYIQSVMKRRQWCAS
jgi:hypothetical protein